MWAFDVVGPTYQWASNSHNYFLTTTEYFTKWVEVIPLKIVEGRHMVSFIHKNLLCHFSVPDDIISNNGSNLQTKN